MIAANYSAVRNNLKEYCDKVCDEEETLIVTRKDNRNVVVMSLDQYNEISRRLRNAEFLEKLDRAEEQIRNGKVIVKTMEELEEMAK